MAADTFTALLGFIKQGTGNNNNTWGALLNSGMIDESDIAIAGRNAQAVTGGTLDLSASPPPAGPSGAIHAILDFSGTLASNQIVQVPNLSKIWIVNNTCTLAGFTLTFKTPAGAASAAIPVGWAIIWCDGANNIKVGLSTALRDVQWLGASGVIAFPGQSFSADPTTGQALIAAGILGLIAAGVGAKINSATQKASAAPAIFAAGAGYAVGDTVYMAGGTFVLPVVVTVATLSGSGIATVTLTQPGLYAVVPANHVAQGSTSGGGSGATFDFTWGNTLGVTDATDATLLTKMGVSTFAATLLQKVNGVDVIAGIGAANIISAIQTNLPLPMPQGYLTPTSNTPVILADVIATTQIFYTQMKGGYTVIHNGAGMIPYQFAQMALTLTSSQAALNIYDIFMAWNAGTPVIGTGPSWAAGAGGSIAAGSCLRGTGAGGTALTLLNGVRVNAASMSLIWNTGSGNTTITVPANQGVYLGSLFVDAVAGQATFHVSYGQSRKWALSNAFNARPILLKVGDSSAPWSYNAAAFRASNGAPANSFTTFQALAEHTMDFQFDQKVLLQANAGGPAESKIGIGYNSITATSGKQGDCNINGTASININGNLDCRARYIAPPALGINVVTALESTPQPSGGSAFGSTEQQMLLAGAWNA